MHEEIDVVVIGAGQAGLATSHELQARGVEHVVLEAETPGSSWRHRWDSFTLVAPNHTVRLPGAPYDGDDPDGFMPRDEMASHLERFAGRLGAPVRSACPVDRLRPLGDDGGGFELTTPGGTIRARVVVVATGAFQRPHVPTTLAGLPEDVHTVDVSGYRHPGALPEGAVLVVGSGQSAVQIGEELVRSGRDVVMACGRAAWFPRRPGGRDVFDWLIDSPFFEQRPEQLPTPRARLGANPQLSGAGGGHDAHFRTLHAQGVRLGGHVSGVENGVVHLAPDLPDTLADSDAGYAMVRDLVWQACDTEGVPRLDLPDPGPFAPEPIENVHVRELGAVVVACGFRTRYAEWIEVPGLLDDLGFPLHVDGESVVAPDLHFVGVHFLRRRRSALLFGVGEDAAATAERVAARLAGERLPA